MRYLKLEDVQNLLITNNLPTIAEQIGGHINDVVYVTTYDLANSSMSPEISYSQLTGLNQYVVNEELTTEETTVMELKVWK